MKGLASTKRELEAGVADAEAELARTEEYCRKLEEMIAVGKATLHAAGQMTVPQLSRPEFNRGSTTLPETDLVKEGRK
jgi:glutaredoxin